MESEPIITPREKSPLQEKFSPKEDRTHYAASSRTASPTHHQRAIPALIIMQYISGTSLLRQQYTFLHIQLAISYSLGILTPGQPVPALTPAKLDTGRESHQDLHPGSCGRPTRLPVPQVSKFHRSHHGMTEDDS